MSKIKGLVELRSVLNKIAFDMNKAIDDAVLMTAIEVKNAAIKSMREPSSGKVYKRGKNKSYTASKEGDAPNIDTARLVESIAFAHEKGSKVAYVGTSVDYGAILETEMNRPWLEPAKESKIGEFGKNVSLALDRQIKKAGK